MTAVDHGVADQRRMAVLHRGDLPERQRPVAPAGYGHVRELLRRGDDLDVADPEPLVRRLDESALADGVARRVAEDAVVDRVVGGIDDLVQGDTRRRHLVLVGLDEDLLALLAPDRDVGHAGDMEQPGADPVEGEHRRGPADSPCWTGSRSASPGWSRTRSDRGPAARPTTAASARRPTDAPGPADGPGAHRCRGGSTGRSPTAAAPTPSRSRRPPARPGARSPSGTVTSCSTSEGDRPRASVWISTEIGANSGNTSTFWWPIVWTPKKISAAAAAITR